MLENTHTNLVIFDLDGVITSEDAYWDTAGLVLHELLYSPRYWHSDGAVQEYHPVTTPEESRRLSRTIFPEAAIMEFKARAVNSNWDTCYMAFCLYLIELLARLPDCSALLPLQPEQEAWTATLRELLAALPGVKTIDVAIFQRIQSAVFQGYVGLELLERCNAYASEVLGHPIEGVFARYSPSWYFCQSLFEEWYLGEQLYPQTYGHPPRQLGKPGCIHFEQPLLPVEQVRTTLETLRARGYTLGIATGRQKLEAFTPLEHYGLLSYFAEQHMTTHDEIAPAEAELRARGDTTPLVKPHPYQFLLAADPDYSLHDPQRRPTRGSFVVVGDTTSDVLGARAAGALVLAVLTGSRTPAARILLEKSQPDFILEDMTQVPDLLAQIDNLATIQRLQFREREKAELLLQRWFALHMNLLTEQVTLMPKAVSLNSFNGVYRANGEDFFFKTHVEEQGILEEYYHAELLAQAGYTIVKPLRTLHQKGQQMVIYPVVRAPVMFDLMRAVETGQAEMSLADKLVAAEKRECERLLALYQASLAASSSEEHARAPIHQLFWHRLTGGRLKSFYAEKMVPLPLSGDTRGEHAGISFEELLRSRWTINGVPLPGKRQTLGEMLEDAKVVLNPARAALTIIGHGDAHFGNVFLDEQQRYCYFDPAFAGRHSPLLDIVKPLFHNVFASWMYFPQEEAQRVHLTVQVREGRIVVDHGYQLAPIRQAIFDTKVQYLLLPLLTLLRAQNALPDDWLDIVRLALLCCPLLTINLLEKERVPTAISWLGFTQALQMGSLALLGEEL